MDSVSQVDAVLRKGNGIPPHPDARHSRPHKGAGEPRRCPRYTLPVPQGARVVDAGLAVFGHGDAPAMLHARLYAEAADDAAPFARGAGSRACPL